MTAGADLLFNDDGTVHLPMLAPLAVIMAEREPRRCLTRQPTKERAEAIMAAALTLARERGHDLEVRPIQDTWGVFLVVAEDRGSRS